MKKWIWICLLAVAIGAQGQVKGSGADKEVKKTVVTPDFKARTGSIYTVTKIELTDTHTKMFAHVVFRPHWWLSPDSTMYLEDVESGLRYQAMGIEGMKFGERFFMPDSGEADVAFIFPPLPGSVKTVNWIAPTSAEDRTYGIDLTKDGNREACLDKRKAWFAQNARQTDWTAEADTAEFFKPDTAYVTGYLEHYDPALEFDTGILSIRNLLQNQDSPEVVVIYPDGRLEGKFLLEHPLHAFMMLGESYPVGDIYLEPGKTLSLYLDFEDFLARNRAREADYPLKSVMYGGELGEVNRQLAEAPDFPLDYEGRMKMKATLTPMQLREECTRVTASWRKELEEYMSAKPVLPKVRQILESQAKVLEAVWLLDYALDYRLEQERDTSATADKTPLPMEFFSFLRNMPLDDERILSVKSALILVNRFSFMDWVWKQASERYEAWLKANKKAVWKPSDILEAKLFMEKSRTEILTDYLGRTDIPFLWQLALCNSVCTTLRTMSDDVSLSNDSTDVVWFMTSLKDSMSVLITHPVLKKTIEHVYRQCTVKQAYQLPPCEGTDIFRKITEPYKGKILLVDFWDIYCGPCRLAIEKSAGLRAKLRGRQDVQLIFITNEGESPEQSYNAYVEKHLKGEAVYRIPSSDYQRLRELFGFNGIPHYVLIGREGEVLSGNYRNGYSAAMLKDLKALGVQIEDMNIINEKQ